MEAFRLLTSHPIELKCGYGYCSHRLDDASRVSTTGQVSPLYPCHGRPEEDAARHCGQRPSRSMRWSSTSYPVSEAARRAASAKICSKAREGGDVADHSTRRAHEEMMVVATEILGKLEAAKVVGTGDASSHLGLAEHAQIPVGRTLRNAGRVGQDGGDGNRSPRQGHRLDQCPPAGGITLADSGEAEGCLQVEPLDVDGRPG